MINKKKAKKGFTLVELLAVIVILAIILVIAVPQIMNTIEESRKGSFESTAKLVASQAERKALENKTLGIEEEIKCEDVASLNDIDYESCNVTFDDEGNAKVTIVGKGKFEGMSVCDATKASVTVSESCDVTGNEDKTAAEKLISLANNEKTSTSNGIQVTSDENVRYVGSTPSNKVYYNCEEKDAAGVSYGEDTYDYANSCEIWRIIGVFEVETIGVQTATSVTPSMTTTLEKRIKIINTESTFSASWDSNTGYGINQWGGNGSYEGADLMQLLNGYYIGSGSNCGYNTRGFQERFEYTCTTESLTSAKMKPLTSNAKSMIDGVVWYTYATDTSTAETAYLQENGITTKYSGCGTMQNGECSYGTRNNELAAHVGLMSVSDIGFANGWLYGSAWTITPYVSNSYAWHINASSAKNTTVSDSKGVWPTVYLKSNIKISGGDGLNTPYKLSVQTDNIN